MLNEIFSKNYQQTKIEQITDVLHNFQMPHFYSILVKKKKKCHIVSNKFHYKFSIRCLSKKISFVHVSSLKVQL